MPLVTTFTLCYYTKAEFVIAAIDSIFNQTYKNIEHIIINDAPDDNIEWPLIKKHIIEKGYNSIIIEHAQNQGITKNLNEITTNAKGTYLCGCSDDLWEPTYIEKQVNFFNKQSKDTAAVFSDLIVINDKGETIEEMFFDQKIDLENTSSNEQFEYILKNNFVFVPAALWTKDATLHVGKYSENLYAEDYQIWVKLLLNGYKIRYNNIREVKYRRRQGAISNTYESSGKMALDRCRLFHQTKTITTHSLWQEVEPIYYKFVKKVIAHPKLTHQVKEEIAKNAFHDLSYSYIYVLRLISLFYLYRIPLINKKLS